MYDIEENMYLGNLVPLGDASEAPALIEDETCLIDTANESVYIPDFGDGNLYGVMVAKLDVEEMMFNDDPVEWALGHVPAPGTGAPVRMIQLSVEEAVDEISERPDDFVIVAS